MNRPGRFVPADDQKTVPCAAPFFAVPAAASRRRRRGGIVGHKGGRRLRSPAVELVVVLVKIARDYHRYRRIILPYFPDAPLYHPGCGHSDGFGLIGSSEF
jgi:hypothetical protein